MITDKEFIDEIHLIIHSVRLIPNYKSSPAEQKIGKLVREKFENSCIDCREINEKIKANPQQEKKGFITKIREAVE